MWTFLIFESLIAVKANCVNCKILMSFSSATVPTLVYSCCILVHSCIFVTQTCTDIELNIVMSSYSLQFIAVDSSRKTKMAKFGQFLAFLEHYTSCSIRKKTLYLTMNWISKFYWQTVTYLNWKIMIIMIITQIHTAYQNVYSKHKKVHISQVPFTTKVTRI